MDDQRFDALVRALGRGSSRRTVLTGLRVATLGAVLSLLGQGPEQAAAKKNHTRQRSKRRGRVKASRQTANKGGNSACTEFCHTAFAGREAGQCTAAAAKGGGPCVACGPAAPACPKGQQRNATTAPCPCECIPVVCDPGFVQDLETCECVPITTACTATGLCLGEATFCNEEEFCPMFGRLSCPCLPTAEGATACVNTCISSFVARRCTSTADCAGIAGATCTDVCQGRFCFIPCGQQYEASFAASSVEGVGAAEDPLNGLNGS